MKLNSPTPQNASKVVKISQIIFLIKKVKIFSSHGTSTRHEKSTSKQSGDATIPFVNAEIGCVNVPKGI